MSVASAVTGAGVAPAVAGAARYDMVVDMSAGNVKLDIVDGTHLRTTGSVALTAQTGNVTMDLLGGLDADLGAAGGNDTLTGNDGVNSLSGGAGNDVLRGVGADVDAAYEALSDDYIPLGLKAYVRDYFSSLEP